MALLKCIDCGREVSDAAPACPGCGRPAYRLPPAYPPMQAGRGSGKGAVAIGAILCIVGFPLVLMGQFTIGGALLLVGFIVFVVGRLQQS